jgi:hypothetical protein
MAVGAGLSASLGIATETTVGTPVAVTRFIEFDSESVALKKNMVQGAGLRQGGLLARASRRVNTGRSVGGDLNFSVTTNGFGLVLQHMLGSFTTVPTSIGGGLYQQIHNVGTLQGRSFTTQIVRPDTSGVLAQNAFTYPGCKITDWEVGVAQNAQVKAKLTLDALDEANPSNGFASTTLSSAVVQAATSIVTVASIPAGAYVVLDAGTGEEVVQTSGAPTGTGPYTSTLVYPATKPHNAGVYVGSATGLNYGAATALQTASYNATTTEFQFLQGSLYAGGTTAVTSGVYTNTGGRLVGTVKSASVKGKNALKTDRYQLGTNGVRAEQIENGWREYTADVDAEFFDRSFYDAYVADSPIALQLKFVAPGGATLGFYAPMAFLDDGNMNVGGPDVLDQKLSFALLDDGVNGALQAVYTSTDAAV